MDDIKTDRSELNFLLNGIVITSFYMVKTMSYIGKIFKILKKFACPGQGRQLAPAALLAASIDWPQLKGRPEAGSWY